MDLLWRITLRLAYRAALCYWFLFRPETKGVYVAVWCGRKILLIRNSYKPKQTFPAGGVKRGESDIDAAIRELHEEVGLSLQAEDLSLFQRFVSREEYKTDKSVVFETHLDIVPSLDIDRREVVHAEFVEMDVACDRELVSVVEKYLAQKSSG
jgi:ADP-ribose pyrophosphatase YjhB (NUDIX family)